MCDDRNRARRVSGSDGDRPNALGLARLIDHSLLRPEATSGQIERLCIEAIEYGFASACVNPTYVAAVARLLAASPVKVAAVAGFPTGAHVTEVKMLEARRAIGDGAGEIDMVINIGALKDGDDDAVHRDIDSVVKTCTDGGALCKVILECGLLTDGEKVRVCALAARAGAGFVKTGTGFSGGGATAEDVRLLSEAVRGSGMGVKAAGGIRSYGDLQRMIQAGATRIGTSAGVAIVKEARGIANGE